MGLSRKFSSYQHWHTQQLKYTLLRYIIADLFKKSKRNITHVQRVPTEWEWQKSETCVTLCTINVIKLFGVHSKAHSISTAD